MLKQLPRETVGAPYLEVLKARLDGAMGSLTEWVATSPWRGGGGTWSSMVFKDPSNQSDSMIL